MENINNIMSLQNLKHLLFEAGSSTLSKILKKNFIINNEKTIGISFSISSLQGRFF